MSASSHLIAFYPLKLFLPHSCGVSNVTGCTHAADVTEMDVAHGTILADFSSLAAKSENMSHILFFKRAQIFLWIPIQAI